MRDAKLATSSIKINLNTNELNPNTPVQNFLYSGCLFKQNNDNNNLSLIIYKLIIYL